MKVTIIEIVIGAFGTVPKRPGRFGSWRPSGDQPNNSIIENGQNTEKSPGDLRRLARELKKLWNMKVTIVPIVIGPLGTITKGLFKGLEDLEVGGRVETIQTTALLRTARILRRVLET